MDFPVSWVTLCLQWDTGSHITHWMLSTSGSSSSGSSTYSTLKPLARGLRPSPGGFWTKSPRVRCRGTLLLTSFHAAPRSCIVVCAMYSTSGPSASPRTAWTSWVVLVLGQSLSKWAVLPHPKQALGMEYGQPPLPALPSPLPFLPSPLYPLCSSIHP